MLLTNCRDRIENQYFDRVGSFILFRAAGGDVRLLSSVQTKNKKRKKGKMKENWMRRKDEKIYLTIYEIGLLVCWKFLGLCNDVLLVGAELACVFAILPMAPLRFLLLEHAVKSSSSFLF